MSSNGLYGMEYVYLLVLNYLLNGHVCGTVNADPGFAVPVSCTKRCRY